MRLKLLTFLGVLLLIPAVADAFEVGARGVYWAAGFAADVKVEKGGVGSTVDFPGELNVEDEYLPGVEAYAGIGDHHLSLAYLPMSYSGKATLGREVRFDGVTFADGEKVEAALDLTMLDLTYRYDLLNMENVLAGFSFGPEIQLKYLEGSAELSGPPGKSGRDDFKSVTPLAGLWAHIGILANILEARGQVAGMVTEGGGKVVDGLVEVVVTPFAFLDVGLGYRMLWLDSKFGGTDLDSQFKGVYLTLAAGW